MADNSEKMTPKAAAVLDAAASWYELTNQPEMHTRADTLWQATRAYLASKEPEGVRPEEVESGRKFMFVQDQNRHGALGYCRLIIADGKRMWHRNGKIAFRFNPDDRIIPIQEDQER